MMDRESKVKVLIVDDNPDNLKVMDHILSDPEIRLIKVNSGPDALRELLEDPEDFALIFMDVRMPGLDGFDVASIIRQREKCSQIPIIFLTAYGTNETGLFKGYSLGAVDFLVKPVPSEILKSKLGVFVDLHKKNKILRVQEELLRRSHEDLEARVRERTAELNRVNEELMVEISERTKAEEALTHSLREKEVLLREIHHRVKNNLQIVSSILNLQGNYITDRKSLEMFADSQSRIKSIALIHELLYQNDDLAQANFGEYLHSLVTNLLRTYKVNSRVGFEIEADTVFLSLDSAIHCGLIVTELVTNSLKYGFQGREEGTVFVSIKDEGEFYVLSAGDDGVGFPEDFDYRMSDSLGLQLVNTLSEQIGGRLELEEGSGTRFTLKFKERSKVRK